MRFNAHKNAGEVLERLCRYSDAKEQYTKALKIQQKDSFIWTRLGFLEYEQFLDLKLAKQCFDAAAQTLSTLERRGTKICPILIKLSEISLREFDYLKSE